MQFFKYIFNFFYCAMLQFNYVKGLQSHPKGSSLYHWALFSSRNNVPLLKKSHSRHMQN